MIELSVYMLERIGIIVIFAFLISKWRPFQSILYREQNTSSKLILIVVFGALGIISSYLGIRIDNGNISANIVRIQVEETAAIANTRLVGVAIAGIFGGPAVGIGAGLIAGVHRIFLGGYTAIACGISTILAGIITGFLGRKLHVEKTFSYRHAMGIGILAECLQMLVILLIARPFEMALNLVQIIAVPMIFMNAFGIFLFCLIIKTSIAEERRTKATQTHEAFQIAQKTVIHFRQGLNEESCYQAAEIIKQATGVVAVAITDQHGILAHVGEGADHHLTKQKIMTKLTYDVLKHGKIIKATKKGEISCPHKDCKLQAALVLPLQVHQQTVGTLKMYFTDGAHITAVEEELAEGLSKLFSTQLEYAEVEKQRKLLKDAEIKALQAQIHPHFFFNSINAISSLIRTDQEQARHLLLQLASFFRSNMQGARQMRIPLEKEIEHIEAYLTIEQARFPNKYAVKFDIDERLLKVLVPPFTLQPLVENAIHHGFKKLKNGEISITARKNVGMLEIIVADNGCGIEKTKLILLGNQVIDSPNGTGTALWNISERLKEIYNYRGKVEFKSKENRGTTVKIFVPIDD
ncbi:sensor histidine kinase [Metasolibacillus sp. FSL H7-0170]|uniref:sensor histidine kinase n=1 Tax=Metasolibacillus sp. FSL H7-0170 TaxID=2921431 RepID=UPI003158B23C